jgi:ATP-dependent metalloprotease
LAVLTAVDRILMGAERRSHYVTEESKRATAYHEGGHALVALHTPGAMPLHKVYAACKWDPTDPSEPSCPGDKLSVSPSSCQNRTKVSITRATPLTPDSYTRREYSAMIDVALGGRAAEDMIFGHDDVTSGCSSDLMRATDVATRMIRVGGPV